MTSRIIKIIGLCLPLALAAPNLHAQDKGPGQVALERLKAGNIRFAEDRLAPRTLDTERRKELLKGEKPFAIILTCADSRVAPEHIFQQGLGDIYVLRIHGNVASPGMIGSIEYALQHQNSPPLIVVMGQENCGAVKAALALDRTTLVEPGAPESHLTWLTRQIEVSKDQPKDPKDALAAAVKYNAVRQAQLLSERSPIIKELVQMGRVQIVPAVYSLSTGKVDWLEMPKLSGRHPVFIKVTVPTAETRVWLDDVETKSRGTKRIYQVDPVDAERDFSYRIKAVWIENGNEYTDVQTVHFKGGMTVSVEFKR